MPADKPLSRLAARARGSLPRVTALLDRADQLAPVTPRSRQLCAGLGVLAEDAYRALGGTRDAEAVGHAAALLALLTKVDDEVIDGRAFHGGPLREGGDAALELKTRRFLAPTLASLRRARAVDASPRSELAALVGAELAALRPDPARLEHLLDVIATGWEVQVRAVSILSRHPARSEALDVARITAEISGYWLLMITMIGALPPDAERSLDRDEERAFIRWGSFIQRADALSDFGKDIETGLANSYAGHMLWSRTGHAYETRCRAGAIAELYALLRSTGVDRLCLPPPGALDEPAAALSRLGEVPAWLHWIHTMLIGRYHGAVAKGA